MHICNVVFYIFTFLGVPNDDNPWGLNLDIHPPTSDEPYWFSVVVDLDKRDEEDSSMQVSQIKLNGNVARVRIEVGLFLPKSQMLPSFQSSG